jgi:RimJ/RimL family protein N-acetyltransferase
MTIRFETPRLTAAQVDAGDDAAAAALVRVLTPAVAAPLPPPLQAIATIADAADWIAQATRDGVLLAIRRRDDSGIAGFVILGFDGGTAHIGYFLGQEHWGQGLGGELVRGLAGWAEGADTVTRLIGIAAQDNAASIATMTRAGFTRDEAVATAAGMIAFVRTT